jgi:hypothetical protein
MGLLGYGRYRHEPTLPQSGPRDFSKTMKTNLQIIIALIAFLLTVIALIRYCEVYGIPDWITIINEWADTIRAVKERLLAPL